MVTNEVGDYRHRNRGVWAFVLGGVALLLVAVALVANPVANGPVAGQPALSSTAAEAPVRLAGTPMMSTAPFRLNGGTYSASWQATATTADMCIYSLDLIDTDGVPQSIASRAVYGQADGQTTLYRVHAGTYHVRADSGCNWAVTLTPAN